MHCLKCGKETVESQVFCDECLAVMQQYPISPSTPVPAPRPTVKATEKKAPRYRALSDEESILQLKSSIRLLTVTVAVLSLLLCLVAGLFLNELEKNNTPAIGKNYTTDTSTQP